jgi:hypothetical protein
VTRSAAAVLFCLGLTSGALLGGEMAAPQSPSPSTKPLRPADDGATATPTPSASPALVPYEVRLANAKSVKVMKPVFGLELGMTVERAHHLLDRLSAREHPPKEEGGPEEGNAEHEDEHKVLWQLAGTDYSAVFIKADPHDVVAYIQAIVRPGKEIPFQKIGELNKAPVQNATTIAWDVIRPKQPLYRVLARGSDSKANTISWFKVQRPGD